MNKILLVDDNPLNLKVLMAALGGKNYELLTATTGERALNTALVAQPNLILLDINMPGWDGYETCRRLKENPQTADIPVVFLSALDDVDSKVKAFQAGGVDYLSKPFNQEEVVVRVNNHLKISSFTAELERYNQSLQQNLEEIKAMQERVAETNEKLTDSIFYAKRLQQAVLPQASEIASAFPENFVSYLPKDVVSGDVYYFKRRRHKVVLAGADCTGHGVPGAFVSMLVTNLFARLVEERGLTEPVSILEEMDFELQKAFDNKDHKVNDGADVAVCTIDRRTLKMQFAGAMRPMYVVREGEVVKLAPDRHSIGGGQIEHFGFTPRYFQLQNGDALYFATDGFADQFGGPTGRKMNARIFTQTLVAAQELPFARQKEFFERVFRDWQGDHPQTDDVLLWGVKI